MNMENGGVLKIANLTLDELDFEAVLFTCDDYYDSDLELSQK